MKIFLASLTLSLCLFGTLGQSDSQRRFHYGQEVASADDYFAPLLRKPSFWPTPWQDAEYKCGGTWIHERYVLATAYCLKYHDINRVGNLEGKETHWKNDLDWLEIDRKHYFANYSYEGVKSFENDIGLVRVKSTFTWTAPFPSIFNDWGNSSAIQKDQVVLYGFGRTENGNYALRLKYMRGRLHFADAYFKAKCIIPSCHKGLSFCFVPQAARDRADNGDMGSPVYYKLLNPANPERENRVLIGMLSNNIGNPRNIILTNLTYYQGWIDSIISISKDPT